MEKASHPFGVNELWKELCGTMKEEEVVAKSNVDEAKKRC